MSATNLSMSPRQWVGVAFVAIVPGELVWFAMLFPLVPRGAAGWAVAAGLGVVVTIWAVVSVAALSWLNGCKKYRLVCNALGLVVALQLGIGIFALAFYHQRLLTDHSSYFGR
jgi:hypothetical protein